MQPILSAASACMCAALAVSQSTVVIPAPAAAAAGNSSNAFPWGSPAAGFPGLRLMAVYGTYNFTSQVISYPIVISELKWRPNIGAAAYSGGTFATATIQMSTSPTGWSAVTTNYATNHGADLTTVYSGAVVHTPTLGTGAWNLQSWCVDVQLQTPFFYDPAAGDLVIDVDYPNGSFTGGTVGQMDVVGTGANAARVYASSMYPAANGITLDHGPVVELTFLPAPGYASQERFGAGCNHVAGSSFYELFAPGTFDLSNSSVSLLHLGSGYLVSGGLATMRPTTSATALQLAGNAVTPRALASGSIPYGRSGQATDLVICSDGYVAVGIAGNGSGNIPTVSTLLAAPYTGWWCWHDYDPSIAGSGQVMWEETAAAVFVTWDGVYSAGAAGPGNRFQMQFEKGTGNVHYVFGAVGPQGGTHLVGYSEGGPSADPGSMDISAALPTTFQVAFELLPLAIVADARPVLGTSFHLLTAEIPANATLGAALLGLTEHNPGLPLAGIGMPGCSQFTSADAVVVFVPAGPTASIPLFLAGNPAFAGVRIKAQSAVYSAGANAANALSSNGLRLGLEVH
ncbi:MAG: hypothetical protein U1E73_06370 [Planctomycetota bacterium]